MIKTITLHNGAEVTAEYDDTNDIWTLKSGGKEVGWAREVPHDIDAARDFADRAARARGLDGERLQRRLDRWGDTAWKLWPAWDDGLEVTCPTIEDVAHRAINPIQA